MEIKLFYCGLCKERERKAMTRPALRKHLKKEHGIKNNITNATYSSKSGYVKQKWWIEILSKGE